MQATATDTERVLGNGSSTITVLPAQPPAVAGDAVEPVPLVNETIIVRAQVPGNTSSIIRYDWNFGPDASTPHDLDDQQSGAGVVEDRHAGTKVITVTAIQAAGPSGDGIATVTCVRRSATVRFRGRHTTPARARSRGRLLFPWLTRGVAAKP